jgi:outer membrane protein insertion porin family
LTDGAQTFYKLRLSRKSYLPVTESITFSTFAEIAYADTFGDTSELLPYERYYTGGTSSVRGYSSNSLGASGTFDANNLPIGGDTKITANMELIIPPPFSGEENSMRMGLFADAGNVFDSATGYDMGELRYSAGVSLMWITPIGPLRFSFAKAFNNEATDQLQNFQFTIGKI